MMVGRASVLRALAILLGIASSILMARLGGAELKGLASAYAAANALAFMALNFDLAQQLLRRGRDSGDLSNLAALLIRTWPYYLIVTGSLGGAALAVGNGNVAWLCLGAVCFLLPTQFGVVSNGIAGPKTTAWGAVLQQGTMAALTLLVHFTVGLSDGSVKSIICIAYVAPLPYFVVQARQGQSLNVKNTSLGLSKIFHLAAQGLRWQPSRLLQLLLLRLDTLVVYGTLGAGAAGIYSVGLSTAALAGLVPAQFAQNATFRATGGPRSQAGHDLVGALASGIACGLLLGASGWFLIPIAYGPSFSDAYWVLLCALPGVVAYAGLQVITNRLRILGQPRIVWIASGGGVVVMVIGLTVMLPALGTIGVAISSSAGCLGALGLAHLGIRRQVVGRP
jgi:O-antigen/teichoic acid export membrane protein